MYPFLNFEAYDNTLNSTFHGKTESSIISEILKTVKLLIQKFTKWYIQLVSYLAS